MTNLAQNTTSDTRLSTMLADSPYQAYIYGYPHKTAYRPFSEPEMLRDIWHRNRDNTDLFLYVHIPFCEMRCGFCNLFTSVKPGGDIVEEYLGALERQILTVSKNLNNANVARFAMGGGTPTYLPTKDLNTLLERVQSAFGAELSAIPASVECSPETATQEKLAVLRQWGVDRISMGVQSFISSEVEAIHRRQDITQVRAALERMNALEFPCINIDLMYGLPDQTPESWLVSLREALTYKPAEIFLYPLYVRPLTRMGTQSARSWDDQRLNLYRIGRDFLIDAGYDALSMRLFRRPGVSPTQTSTYTNTTGGMVGLGCGARSYTSDVHYSNSYAVGPSRVKQIIRDFILATNYDFAQATYGFTLDLDEQRRRFILLGLLSDENTAKGLDLNHYRAQFGSEAIDDYPELGELTTRALATLNSNTLRLTASGIERTDTLGPWLFSSRVDTLMHGYKTR